MNIIAVGVRALAAFFMRKTRIFYKGAEYTVLSGFGVQDGRNEGRVICVTPAITELSDLDIIDLGTVKTEPREALKILEIYLVCALGYPDMELVVSYAGTRYTVQIFSTHSGIRPFSVENQRKREINTVAFGDGVELNLETVISREYRARVYRCRDSELCFHNLLRRLLVIDNLVGCDTAVIVGDLERAD